jgi:carnosine N-methyltransferase
MMRPERIKLTDIEKMRSTLKSFYREWSAEGRQERDQCYKPIIDEVEAYFTEIGRKPYDPQTG